MESLLEGQRQTGDGIRVHVTTTWTKTYFCNTHSETTTKRTQKGYNYIVCVDTSVDVSIYIYL